MSEANKALVRRWFEEVWNQGRVDAIDDMLAGSSIAHGLKDERGNPIRSAADFKSFYQKFRQALSDVVVTVENMIAEGDQVAVRYRLRATHSGNSLGPAATHKPIEYTGMGIVRVADGKIIEAWNNFDTLSLYQQIGGIASEQGPLQSRTLGDS